MLWEVVREGVGIDSMLVVLLLPASSLGAWEFEEKVVVMDQGPSQPPLVKISSSWRGPSIPIAVSLSYNMKPPSGAKMDHNINLSAKELSLLKNHLVLAC